MNVSRVVFHSLVVNVIYSLLNDRVIVMLSWSNGCRPNVYRPNVVERSIEDEMFILSSFFDITS
jgi:hypothetical protein